MLKFPNGGCLVQSISELPPPGKRIFLDLETTSGDPKLDSLNPWHHCNIAGICYTMNDTAGAWYIPVRHPRENLPLDAVLQWVQHVVDECGEWVNHNIKYDVHVLMNEGIDVKCRIVDTLTLAKLINSDRLQYGLSSLSRDWLEEDIDAHEKKLKQWLADAKSKDYGDLPADLIAPYGCQDVLTNRKLFNYIERRLPEECKQVFETEVSLTSVLVQAERRGFRVDPTELKKREYKLYHQLLMMEAHIEEVTSLSIRPHVSGDCYELLCNHYGLPVLGVTEKKNPSFNKEALAAYGRHPLVAADEEMTDIVETLSAYRGLNTLKNFFVEPYQRHQIDGLIHPWFNQSVRTGRMSSKEPNAQQLSHDAKLLIHPHPGYVLWSWDYSQVEFRLIVHYIQNPVAIQAYADDPDTDFHVWVAELAGIPRKPAKSINFAIGFGAGRDKVLTMLARDKDLMKSIVKTAGSDFERACKLRAAKVYETYHATLPELRSTAWRASQALKAKGFVKNAYGRHRHLPVESAWRAFNTVIQGCAADLMKERTVAVAKAIPEFDIHIVAIVHDEILFEAPVAAVSDPAIEARIRLILEQPAVDFRVPIKVDSGWSNSSWGQID